MLIQNFYEKRENMFRIGICDDNPMFAKNLEKIVKNAFSKHECTYDIQTFSDGIVLLSQNRLEPFDVLFLTIDMPKVSGFEIAKLLREDFSRCFIIFVTSHAELVFESMNYQPFNFIRKNCNIPLEESVSNIVGKLVLYMRQDDSIVVDDQYCRKHSMYIRNILYVQGDDHYLLFKVIDKSSFETIRAHERLKDFESLLMPYSFVRIHKSYLVNLKYVTFINKRVNEIEVKGGIRLPLSRNYKHDAEEKYVEYMMTRV